MALPSTFAKRAYTFLLCFLAAAMPNLNLLMSIGVILLFILWLFTPGPIHGWRALKENRPALLLIGLFAIHAIWLFNTSEFAYAFKDLRIKLPLLILGVVLGSIPLSRRQLKLIFLALSVGVWTASLAATYRYYQLGAALVDHRQIVHGISHIRLSLLMVVQVAAILHFWPTLSRLQRIYSIAVVANVVFFLNILQSVTGMAILLLLFGFTLVYVLLKTKSRTAYALLFVLFLTGLVTVYFSYDYYQNYFVASAKTETLESKTARGSKYYHILDAPQVENKSYTFRYLASDEMIEAWNERSKFKIEADNPERSERIATLHRYLTSKGLRKDYDGVMALNEKDILNIERGYPNEIYSRKSGLALRHHTFLFGLHVYLSTGQVAGHSFFQRLLYWKVAYALIKEHPLLGTGTGDVKQEFAAMHSRMNPDLDDRYKLRAHNQFLTFFVSFGIIGFLYFIALFLYSAHCRRHSLLALSVLLIAFISCLSEDTLETQAGATFFAFFLALVSKPAAQTKSK